MNKMQFRQLKNNDETIIYYKIMDESGHYSKDTYSIFCQKPYDEKCDITAFIEDTLHRILEEGYSAFLICHTDDTLTAPDFETCHLDFPHFVKLQDTLILNMKKCGYTMKSCFGF